MTLSRTARIMIGVLLLAAAAFFWVNFFSREQSQPAPVTTAAAPKTPATTPSTSPGTSGKATTGQAAASPTGGQPSGGQAGAGVSTNEAQQAPTQQATTSGAASEGGNAPIAAPGNPAVATHDLQVAELPFLVTQPPEQGTAGGSQQAATTSTSGGPAQTAASAQRMSVNPFSPIVVQAAAPKPAATAPTPPPTQQVTTQPAPQQPQKQQTLAEAPAPKPVAPPPPPTGNLASALPSGMLPSTPGVLQTPRAVATSSAPTDLGKVAAVKEPGSGSTGPLGNVTGAGVVAAGPSVPDLLGPGQPTQPPQPPKPTSAAANASGTPPLQAGTDTLSRYLRDHNVRFTGTVLGPVSVGVFRSDQYTAPVVVSLGQVLPETKITLTDLRGHTAVFSYEDTTQSLSLDLRR